MENALNLNLRIFRRNAKNTIIVWNTANLDESLKNCTSAFAVQFDGTESLLTFSKFVPDSPEKFPKDIDGIIVPHASNNIDPLKAYFIKIIFGDEVCRHEEIKEVFPAVTFTVPDPPKSPDITHMYAYDYKNSKWVPLPVDTSLMEGR